MNKKIKILLKTIVILSIISLLIIIWILFVNKTGIRSWNEERSRIDWWVNSYESCVNAWGEISGSYPKMCSFSSKNFYEKTNIHLDEIKKPIPLINEEDILKNIDNIDGNFVVDDSSKINLNSID